MHVLLIDTLIVLGLIVAAIVLTAWLDRRMERRGPGRDRTLGASMTGLFDFDAGRPPRRSRRWSRP